MLASTPDAGRLRKALSRPPRWRRVLEPVLLQLPATPEGLLRWPVIAAAGALLVVLLGFKARSDLADAMGLDRADVALLTVGSIAAPVLNVPLALRGEAVLAVNLGGAIVPLLVAVRLRRVGKLPWVRTAALTGVVAGATWAIVSVEPDAGVVAPFPQFLLPGAVALLGALALTRGRPTEAGPLAFASGAIGALVGADLLALPRLLEVADQARPGTALILGGGGAFDLIFLSGAVGLALSLFLALVVTRAPSPRLADPRAAPRRVPDPRDVLERLERLEGLSPRERCISHLARANRALASQRPSRAVEHAHAAVDALLRAGSPTVLSRIGQQAPEEVKAWMRELTEARRRLASNAPEWHEAADTVELAKVLTGALWRAAPGRVRLPGGTP